MILGLIPALSGNLKKKPLWKQSFEDIFGTNSVTFKFQYILHTSNNIIASVIVVY
jgi:hypothetical protein